MFWHGSNEKYAYMRFQVPLKDECCKHVRHYRSKHWFEDN